MTTHKVWSSGSLNPLVGICAGAPAVSEVFSHVRGDSPEAGYCRIGLSLWNPLAIKH